YPDRTAHFRKALSFWVEHPRYNPADGAPVVMLLERTRAVRDYFAARLADKDPIRSAASATGYAQAGAVAAALDALAGQGESSITPVELEALISQCTARGAPNFAMHAQVGCVPAASDPGAL